MMMMMISFVSSSSSSSLSVHYCYSSCRPESSFPGPAFWWTSSIPPCPHHRRRYDFVQVLLLHWYYEPRHHVVGDGISIPSCDSIRAPTLRLESTAWMPLVEMLDRREHRNIDDCVRSPIRNNLPPRSDLHRNLQRRVPVIEIGRFLPREHDLDLVVSIVSLACHVSCSDYRVFLSWSCLFKE